MSSRRSRLLESMPSISRLEDEVESNPKPPAQEHSQLLELSPEMVSRSAELRMSLPFQPIQPDVQVVAEVEDSELLE